MSKFLQFGEGNFLRAFAEEYIQEVFEEDKKTRVTICQPRTNTRVINALKAQNCRYEVILRGMLGGKIVDERKEINCVESCIDTVGEYEKLKSVFCSDELEAVISNTTEAGICYVESDKMSDSPSVSFPAKLTALLYERFTLKKSGLVFIPVELIENNGAELKKCILKYADLWSLGEDFASYVNGECSFCNTLVDRIVTGHTEGDSDPCSVSCEPYKSWIIEADERARAVISFKNITFTDDLKAYRIQKVRILNGIHTMTVPSAYMAGFSIVRDTVRDNLFSSYIEKGSREIKATLPMNSDGFAKSVIERFDNPFIDHKLTDILLNSISKFKVRCLDTLIDYYNKYNSLPSVLTFSLAALISFYLSGDSAVNDGKEVMQYFASKPSVSDILKNADLWGRDLTEIDGLENRVISYFESIENGGIINAVKEVVNEKAD